MAEPVDLSGDEIVTLVNRLMMDVFEVDEDALAPDAHLIKDLDLDSLDGVDLVVALEKTFHCKIAEEEARSIETLGDIYDKVTARLKQTEEEAV